MAKPKLPTARQVKSALRRHVNPEKAAFYPKFFKTGKGQYGEGDRFLGVVVPDQRKIANLYKHLPRSELDQLIQDPFHECRMTALLILVKQFEKADDDDRTEIVEYYLSRLDFANNWDLVDCSAHKILGAYLVDKKDQSQLAALANSNHLWRERTAMIATLAMIKQGDYSKTLSLAEHFLDHPHDLMHKATGWMLREVGKGDERILKLFLNRYYTKMPRTMLRYAIERLEARDKAKYMKK